MIWGMCEAQRGSWLYERAAEREWISFFGELAV